MKELKRITEIYKVDTETAAAQLIQEFKDGQGTGNYELTKYSSQYKNKKAKGEIVEEFYMVAVQKDYALEE